MCDTKSVGSFRSLNIKKRATNNNNEGVSSTNVLIEPNSSKKTGNALCKYKKANNFTTSLPAAAFETDSTRGLATNSNYLKPLPKKNASFPRLTRTCSEPSLPTAKLRKTGASSPALSPKFLRYILYDSSPSESSSSSSSFSSISLSETSNASSSSWKLPLSVSQLSLPEPPDGGWGWVVVVAAFFVHMITDGVIVSFGVFLEDLVEEFDDSVGATSWIGSFSYGVPALATPVASVLLNRFGCRTACMLGGFLSALGCLIGCFTNSILSLVFSFGILSGLGASLSVTAALVIVSMYFDDRRATATGLSIAGTGVGALVFAPLVDVLLTAYTWRGTLMIMSGFFLNLMVCGALMRPVETHLERRHRQRLAWLEHLARESGLPIPEKSAEYLDRDVLERIKLLRDRLLAPRRVTMGYLQGNSSLASPRTDRDLVRFANHDIFELVPEDNPGPNKALSSTQNSEKLHAQSPQVRLVPISFASGDASVLPATDHYSVLPQPTLMPIPEDDVATFNAIRVTRSQNDLPSVGQVDPPQGPGDPQSAPTSPIKDSFPSLVSDSDCLETRILFHGQTPVESKDQKPNKDVSDNLQESIWDDKNVETQEQAACFPSTNAKVEQINRMNFDVSDKLVCIDQLCVNLIPKSVHNEIQLTVPSDENCLLQGAKTKEHEGHTLVSHPKGINQGPCDRVDIFYRGSLVNAFNLHHATHDTALSLPELHQIHRARKSSGSNESSSSGSQISVFFDCLCCGSPNLSDKESSSYDKEWKVKYLGCVNSCAGVFSSRRDLIHRMCDLRLFRRPTFSFFILSNFLLYFWYNVTYFFMGVRAIHYGLTDTMAALLFSVLGGANMIGEVAVGFLADRECVDALMLYLFMLLACGVSTCLVPLFTNFISMAAYATVFGMGMAANDALCTVLLVEFIGLPRLTNGLGICFFCQGVANILGPPVIGYIIDLTQSHEPAYLISGVGLIFSGLVVIPIIVHRARRKRARQLRRSLQERAEKEAAQQDKESSENHDLPAHASSCKSVTNGHIVPL